MASIQKTNVMRILDASKIDYKIHTYPSGEAVSGDVVAKMIGEDAEHVFKTLVTVSKSGENYVFVIPVLEELDLKKAAEASGEKAIAMLKSKDLLPLTGYIHGGCSPIGMKKPFKTFIDEAATLYDTIIFSAGKIGFQVEMKTDDLKSVIDFEYANITA